MDDRTPWSILVGEKGTLLLAFIIGFVAAVIYTRVIDYTGQFYFIFTIDVSITVIVIILIGAITVAAGGGLLAVWIGTYPVFFSITRQTSGGLIRQRSLATELIEATFLMLFFGTFAYLFAILGIIAYSKVIEESSSTDVDGDGSGISSVLPIKRRTFLLVAGVTVVGASVVHGFRTGFMCKTSPVDLLVKNGSQGEMTATLSINGSGSEVFREAITFTGVRDASTIRAGHDTERVSFDDAITLPCGLPESITVHVEADTGLSTTESVTVPKPAPPSGGGYQGTILSITVFDDHITSSVDHAYWVS